MRQIQLSIYFSDKYCPRHIMKNEKYSIRNKDESFSILNIVLKALKLIDHRIHKKNCGVSI